MTARRTKKQSVQVNEKKLRNELEGKTYGQREYIRCLLENDITFCTGPAGSGKSICAIGIACKQLLEGKVSRIIIARPAVEASPKGLGFLKGGLMDKLYNYVLPAIEHMKYFLGENLYNNYVRDGKIQFEAVEYMRGRTYNYAWLIIDESQNLTTDQLKMVVSRIGSGSKMCLNGDTDQTDLKNRGEDSDFQYVIDKVSSAEIDGFGFHEMCEADIVRNRLITPFLRALK